MADDIQNDFGVQALDVEALARRYQNAVIDGCEVSAGSGDIEIDVASGTVAVAGSTHDLSETTVTLTSGDASYPRKDVVYVDSSGDVQTAMGSPEAAKPSGKTGRATFQPSPPDLSQTDACVLAEVWVAAGASAVDGSDISDRRVLADAVFGDLTASTSLTDPAGTEHTGELADLSDVGSGRTDEEIEDVVAALLAAGDKLSWTYDDANDVLTVDTTALDEEEVEDAVNSLLAADSNLTLNYDDAGDTLTIGLADSIDVGTVSADASLNEDNPATARVFKDGSTYRAHGRSETIASGADAASVIQAAMDAVADTDSPGTGQRIKIARGVYDCGQTITLQDGVTLQGEGIRATVLQLADNTDADLLEYTADDASDDRDFFTGLFDLKLQGNKSNNSAGHGLYAYKGNSNSQPNDFHMSRVFVHSFPEDGAHFAFSWGNHITNCLFETNGEKGLHFQSGQQNYISDIFTAYNSETGFRYGGTEAHIRSVRTNANGYHGIMADGKNCTYVDCRAKNDGQDLSSQAGIYVFDSGITLDNCRALDTQSTPTMNTGIVIRGDDAKLDQCRASGASGTDLDIRSESTDASLKDCDYGTFNNAGTRTRWNGVIGGGPIGGVDLTAVTPSEEGVRAMSDGTATGFPEYAEARRDTANSQWVRVDGQETV